MPTQPTHSPPAPAPHSALRSLVVKSPIGLSVVGPLLLGLLLVITALLQAVAGPWQPSILLAGLPGLGLLGLAWRGARRGNHPMLLTSRRESLHLEPMGRSIQQGVPAETIMPASIKAYKYWSQYLRYQAFFQFHLRLELADGRVLHLADQPGERPDDPPGTVRLNEVARKLARWVAPGTQQRQLFFLTRAARLLLWLSWAAIATALALLGLGYPAGCLLLFPAVGYGAIYYLFRKAAELTA